jgi:sec-independent protein translocase protein TatC
MVALYFVGLFGSFLLVMHREGRKFPWGKVALGIVLAILVSGGALALLFYRYHYHFLTKWPYLSR